MLAENFEKLSAEKDNQQCCLVKIRIAVCKIVKQILSKDIKVNESNNNNNGNKHFQDSREHCQNNNSSFDNEIEQNQANERLLKASQSQKNQPYVLSIETTVGSFYWECGMQRDSFADFNFNAHWMEGNNYTHTQQTNFKNLLVLSKTSMFLPSLKKES